jgi:hypothetical protein
LTVGSTRYLAAIMIAFALLVAEYVQTFFGYGVAQLLVLFSIVLLWLGSSAGHVAASLSKWRGSGARTEEEKSAAGSSLGAFLLLYVAGTIRWATGANLEWRRRQVARILRRARRRLRIRR